MLLMNSISDPDRRAPIDVSDYESVAMPNRLLGARKRSFDPGRTDFASEPPCRLATLDLGVLRGLQRLERRLGKSVLPGMFDILKRHLPRSCAQLWRALDKDDASTIRQISHKLKSSARCLGLPRLGEICARLEKDAKEGRLRGAERQLAAIEMEYDRAVSALQHFIAPTAKPTA